MKDMEKKVKEKDEKGNESEKEKDEGSEVF